MGAQVMAVAKQQVAGRAAFDTDILLLNLLNQVRVHDQIETVTNSLGA